MLPLLPVALTLALSAQARSLPDEWTVSAAAAPASPAPADDAFRRWFSWFVSEPGGPNDAPGPARPGEPFRVPGYTAPAPMSGDWRKFETPERLGERSELAMSDALASHDGIERVAYRYGGDVYFAQRTGTERGAGWRHERVASTSLEWGRVALARDNRARSHLAFEVSDGGGRRWVYAVREPYGLWSQERLPALGASSGRCARLLVDGDLVPHLLVEAEGKARRLLSDFRDGRGWHEDGPPFGELGPRECPAAALDSDGSLMVAWSSPDRELRLSRTVPGWATSVIARSAMTPRFVASPEGGLAISFKDLASGEWRLARRGRFTHRSVIRPLWPVAPSSHRRPSLLWFVVFAGAARMLLVLRRKRSRRALRAEAALVGRGVLVDVVVRRRGARGFRPAAAGVLLLHSRASVLWAHGLKPSEVWLGAGWSVMQGRPGWIELRCGPVELEVAPESGLWPRASAAAARRLLDALQSSRALQRELVSQS